MCRGRWEVVRSIAKTTRTGLCQSCRVNDHQRTTGQRSVGGQSKFLLHQTQMSFQVTGAGWSYNLQCGRHRFWSQQWGRLPCTSSNYCDKLNWLIVTLFPPWQPVCYTRKLHCIHNQLIMNQTTTTQCATKHNTDLCHHNHYPAQTTPMLPKKATRLCTVVNSVVTMLMCLQQGNCTVPINGIWLQLLYAAKNDNSYNLTPHAAVHAAVLSTRELACTHQLNLRIEQFL